MRYRELIESPNAYLPMFNGVPTDKATLVQHIRKVETAFKRQDRITWYLRWSRVSFMAQAEHNDQPIDEKSKRKALSAINPTITWDDAVDESGEVMNDFESYKHFVDMTQIAAIQELVWDKQTPYDLIHTLADLENEWLEQIRETTVRPWSDDEILIDFKNGWAWWLLNRGYCSNEADAMGHCGNAGAAHGDRILSLRQKIADDRWEPHLTFILDSRGLLGEMKGKGNEKPVQAYHKYIVALLRNPIVNGIKGGGYLPENNFSMDDLPKDVKKALMDEKPGLKELSDVYYDWTSEEDPERKAAILEQLKAKLETALESYNYERIVYEAGDIILASYKLEAFIRRFSHYLACEIYKFIDDDLEVILEDAPNAPENVRDIYEKVKSEYLMPLFEQTLSMGVRFHLSDVRLNLSDDNQIVDFVISIRDFVYDHNDELQNAGGDLASESDSYYDRDDIRSIDTDDIGDEIVACAVEVRSRRDVRKLTDLIFLNYETTVHHSPTINDPDQLDLFH